MKKFIMLIILFICLFIIEGTVNAKMSANFPIVNETGKQELAISAAFDGTNYLVLVMVIPQPDLWSLYAQFVSKTGSLGTKVAIVENSTTRIYNARVAYGGGKYLVIWTDIGTQYTDVKGVFINPDGTKVNIFTIVSGIPSEWNTVPDIAYGGGKFLVAYEKPFSQNMETHLAIYGKLIDLNGSISSEFKISALWGGFNLQHIAFDGTNFLVVYRDDKDDARVLAMRVSPQSGGPVEGELILDNNNLPSENPLAVFFDGEKYLIVWTDQTQGYPNIWQFYGKFVYPNGVQTDPFTITTGNSWKVAPFIAFDGAKYLITWNEGRNCGFGFYESMFCIRTGIDIYGRYFSKSGAPLGGEFIVSQLSGDEVGGFIGRTVGGKVLGIINKNFNFEIFSADDVDGKFWISSGYDIFAPDNKEKVMAGSTYTIRWQAPAKAVKFDIYYSNDNGQSWNLIKSGHNTKTLNWTVPAQDGRKANCKIKIDAYDSSGNKLITFFSRVFSIEVAKIIQPNGGELLTSGQTYTIKWQTQGLSKTVANVQLQYSFNGNTWKNIKTLTGNPGQTNWKIPAVDGIKPTCLIRVIFKDENGNNIAITESEVVFTIELLG